MNQSYGLLIAICNFFFFAYPTSAQIKLVFDAGSAPIVFGAGKLQQALEKYGYTIENRNNPHEADIIIHINRSENNLLRKEGFQLTRKDKQLVIHALDASGAMYGAMDVAEQVSLGKTLSAIQSKVVNPHFSVRAVKFNLPWSPYRYGPAMDQHYEVCRDLAFWQKFLDQMAENRFNLLSLWNVHPFSYMVKPENFPHANDFSPKEMEEWKEFWKSLFRMARERGIEPFIVNWNIAVSPEFAKAYQALERNDTSSIVKRYTREVVTQTINEYEDLAGIGITLADWMSNFSSPGGRLPEMSPKDREDWIEETVVAGIKNANRPVKFLHRSVLSADPAEMRRVINHAALPDTTLVEIKFNWSHGHSTPTLALTHDSHSGARDDGYWNPLPDNYRIQWMVRNEDFFILRWGQPDFIREHIRVNNHKYVNGYFIGSEGYIPAMDYSHKNSDHFTWTYAFEKQWLFYHLWGRLLYDPQTSDDVFSSSFESQYGNGTGKQLLESYKSASQMPLRLASFFASTWDYTLYSEGFLAPVLTSGFNDRISSFISIDELIDHPTLDPSYISIKEYAKGILEKSTFDTNAIHPLKLADQLEHDSRKTLSMVQALRINASGTLTCELDDLETWAWLSQYFADKLRAGVSLQLYRLTDSKKEQLKAITLLNRCLSHWKKVSSITEGHYKEVPYIDGQTLGPQNDYKDAWRFTWSKYIPQAERDIEIAKASERR